MKTAYIMLTAVLAGLAGIAGTVLVMQPSQAVSVTRPAVSPALAPAEQGGQLASLGPVSLGDAEVSGWLAGLSAPARTALKQDRTLFDDWARRRLAEKALIHEAREQGWEKREEVVRAVDQAGEQVLLRSYLNAVSQVPEDFPDEETLRQVYHAAKAELQVPERYHLRQIFLAANGDDAGTMKARAEQLARQARGKNADFADLARQHSDDAVSAPQGGDIGTQPLAQLMPPARSVVASLKDGEVSAPFQTASGWHVLKLEKKEAARTAALEDVREQLRTRLREQRRQQNAQAYLDRLVGAASLSIDGAAVTALLNDL